MQRMNGNRERVDEFSRSKTPSITTGIVPAILEQMRMPIPSALLRVLIISTLTLSVSADKFDQCLINLKNDVKNGTYGPIGGTDNDGNPVAIGDATALQYELCLQACGHGPQSFEWSTFSQQFSAWLLPWLALLSQLPFGATFQQDNLLSVVLTVGSPTLAAFSLALTVMNGHWIALRFRDINYPNAHRAVRVLSSLQQMPLRVTTKDGLLASLVVLPENDKWWETLQLELDYTHTWSIAAATSIAWVVVAYLFTVIDGFANLKSDVNSNGQGVGSAWLWLLPIVTGWLQVSPKCDSGRLHRAINSANEIAYVATERSGVQKASTQFRKRGFAYRPADEGSVFRVQECSPPLFNYARFLPWIHAVEVVHSAFYNASAKADQHETVSGCNWVGGATGQGLEAANRTGTMLQVMTYCTPTNSFREWDGIQEEGIPLRTGGNITADEVPPRSFDPTSHDDEVDLERSSKKYWGSGTLSRCLVASILALGLQWGTAGAGVTIEWNTPTKGLGCRSGAYLVYAAASTVVWIILVASSILAHCEEQSTCNRRSPATGLAGWFSVCLRRLGNVLATLNAMWIIVICLFQFTNFFDRCYCNSSVIGLGSRAYNVIILGDHDISFMKTAWIGGVTLALSCAFVFMFFVNMYINPPSTP